MDTEARRGVAATASESLLSSTLTPAASRRDLVFLGICLVLAALNLRTLFSSFSAVLPEIKASSALPGWAVGLLTTVPVTFLGIFAPICPLLARRFGLERVLIGALLLLTAGLGLRGFHVPQLGHLPSLLIGTAACGIAIALANVLIPALVKRDFQHQLGLMSGLTTAAACASAALGAGLTYPIFTATGAWESSLLFWALPAAVAAVFFSPAAVRQRHPPREKASPRHNVWHSAIAWHVTIFMMLQAMMSFSVFAWLAPILQERGVEGDAAGLITSISIVLQVFGCLLAPILATRLPDQRLLNVAAALLTGTGFALCVFAPIELIWFSTALLGLSQGSLTASALTMVIVRTGDSQTAADLSSMMQCVGYGLGSSGTLLVGQLFHWTGSFAAAGLLFIVVGTFAAGFGYQAGRKKLIGDPGICN